VNFLADESVDGPIVYRLRQDGHEVLYVAEMEPGISDEVILERGNQHQAVLVTIDKDFGELVFRQKLISKGVVLVRLAGLSLGRKADLVAAAVRQHEGELPGCFTVISPGRVRIRRGT
jgi:predicted nuclease of predicted toxin-antitoxin system